MSLYSKLSSDLTARGCLEGALETGWKRLDSDGGTSSVSTVLSSTVGSSEMNAVDVPEGTKLDALVVVVVVFNTTRQYKMVNCKKKVRFTYASTHIFCKHQLKRELTTQRCT